MQKVRVACCVCHRERTDDGRWTAPPSPREQAALPLSHGYCPTCADALRAEIRAYAAGLATAAA
jgi:hypothetical protein